MKIQPRPGRRVEQGVAEALDRDPRTARLANGWQARIADKADEPAMTELRAELERRMRDR